MPTSVQLNFQTVAAEVSVGILSLNRPEAANAFNAAMISEISACLDQVAQDPHCRCLVVQGRGKHLSAGADLAWMRASAALSLEENRREAHELASMFERLARLPIPSVGVAKGAVYGGAVGLIAACDFAIASSDTKFCLSEVALGLLPAVILPHLQRKIGEAHLRRLSLTASVFSAGEASAIGLITQVCDPEQLGLELSKQVRALLAGGPAAQRRLKALFYDLATQAERERELTTEAIAQARSGPEGQEGLKGFFAKSAPAWRCQLPPDWSVEL